MPTGKKILYIWKSEYPWDIRIDKICNSLVDFGYDTAILAKFNSEYHSDNISDLTIKENTTKVKVFNAFSESSKLRSIPIPFNPFWEHAIEKYVIQFQPDLLIIREIVLAQQAYKVAYKYNIPIIMDMAEHYPAAMAAWKKYRKSLLSRLLIHHLKIPAKLEKYVVPKMDGIITVCQEQSQRLNQSFDYSFNQMAIVHNTPRKEIKQSKYLDDSRDINFLHHGYLSSDKSIEKFIIAFKIAYQSRTNIRLTISGSGEDFDYLQKLASNCKGINFTGNYHYSELREILSKADIGVLPYPISEFNNTTIHNKVFDYFASCVPVLVSESIPLMRIVNETKSGLIVDCENVQSIVDFLLKIEKNSLHQLSINSYNAYINKYNWETDSGHLIKFIKEFV